MPNKFVSFLETAGKNVEHVFTDILTPAHVAQGEALVSAILPTSVSTVFNLVANTVILVEQKFAAIGKQTGSGSQKLAQVLAVVGSTVASIFAANKIAGDVTGIVNAIVTFLNSLGANPTSSTTNSVVGVTA